MHQPIPTSSGNHYRESPAATRSPSPGLRHHYMRPAASSSNIKELVGFQGQIIVLKVGTSSLVDPEQSRFNLSAFARIVETVKRLHEMGHYVILISSGAVAMGCHRLNLELRPHDLAKKQALAAIGQGHLMKFWEDFLHSVGLTCAQVLVTLENLAVKGQYLNVRNTFTELLAYGVIPVVNENDSTSIQKLRFGDNDTLAAHVAAMVQANWLFLMTDVDHLYTANPKTNPDAEPIYEVHDMHQLEADTSEGEGTQWGTGGMATKLTAARIATAAGTTMAIINCKEPESVVDVVNGKEKIGTKFYPIEGAPRGRKRWILGVPVCGDLWLNEEGAKTAAKHRKSVFAEGIVRMSGSFQPQDAVRLYDENGNEFARGLINCDSKHLSLRLAHAKIASSISPREACVLPDADIDEVLHRDNITMLEDDGLEEEDIDKPTHFFKKETSQGQLQWIEKMASDRDALKLQHQLQELAADGYDVQGNLQICEERHIVEEAGAGGPGFMVHSSALSAAAAAAAAAHHHHVSHPRARMPSPSLPPLPPSPPRTSGDGTASGDGEGAAQE